MSTAANHTTRASHSSSAPAAGETSYLRRPEGRIGYDVTAPALVVMGEQDPDFGDPRAEADWIARALRAQVVMVPEAGHYPQSRRPGITAGAVLRFLESVLGRAQGRPACPSKRGRIAGEVAVPQSRK
jgi:pimeloyl-ACP methyl ester carboxylesterase